MLYQLYMLLYGINVSISCGEVRWLWRFCRWHNSTGLDAHSKHVKTHSPVCEDKDKVVPVQAKMVQEIVEIQLHSFFISGLDGRKCGQLHVSVALTPGEKTSDI